MFYLSSAFKNRIYRMREYFPIIGSRENTSLTTVITTLNGNDAVLWMDCSVGKYHFKYQILQ